MLANFWRGVGVGLAVVVIAALGDWFRRVVVLVWCYSEEKVLLVTGTSEGDDVLLLWMPLLLVFGRGICTIDWCRWRTLF